MVATSYVGCNSTSLAVVLFSLALGASNLNAATYRVNHLDIAPRFSGVLMGITNSAGTIPGIIGPFVVGLLTDNQVCFWRNDYVLCRRRWFQVMDLIWYWIAPFLFTRDRSVDENRAVVVPFFDNSEWLEQFLLSRVLITGKSRRRLNVRAFNTAQLTKSTGDAVFLFDEIRKHSRHCSVWKAQVFGRCI